MEEGRASETARLSAVLRAAHPVLDAQPWVFVDELAAHLAGVGDRRQVLAAVEAFRGQLADRFSPALAERLVRGIRMDVTVRARYVEDQLAAAVDRGTGQYVILGAGLDSFAYRRLDLGGRVEVFEIDHPATQHRKRERLAQLGLGVPPNVTFVPVDFERDTILDRLRQEGFRLEQPAFFSWLGVAWYLTESAVFETLAQVAAAATGSQLVLEYAVREELLRGEASELLRAVGALAAGYGEPVRTEFAPEDLASRVAATGFGQLEDVGAAELDARYLAGRADRLGFPGHLRLLTARV